MNVFVWNCNGFYEKCNDVYKSVKDVVIELEVCKLKMNNWWIVREMMEKDVDVDVVIGKLNEFVSNRISLNDNELLKYFDLIEYDGKKLYGIGEDSSFVLSDDVGFLIDFDGFMDDRYIIGKRIESKEVIELIGEVSKEELRKMI